VTAPNPQVSPRQWLSERQTTTVNALLDAGLAEIRDHGYETVTLRGVAKRAGLTHTTAYSYFTSKEHLVSEIYWRQLQTLAPARASEGASLVDRVRTAFEAPTMALAAEPELAGGVLVAILGDDPDIRRIREQAGQELVHRMVTALAPVEDAELVETLLIAYSGAMIVVGTGSRDYGSVLRRLETFARQIDPTGAWTAPPTPGGAVTQADRVSGS